MPWLGYLDKMDRCDLFVFLDNVQYKKNEYQNRNRIKSSRGWQWLTVPTHYKFPQKINEVQINNSVNWRTKHLHSLMMNYGKSSFYKKYIEHFEELYQQDCTLLSKLNMASVILIKELLGIKSETVIASDMNDLSEEPSQRLVDICVRLGANTYLAGTDSIKYMDVDRFRDAGINVTFQEFQHPVYTQMFHKFESSMSAIDLIFNCGEQSMEIIRKETAHEFAGNRSAS
jgi:aryl carrier-like protein